LSEKIEVDKKQYQQLVAHLELSLNPQTKWICFTGAFWDRLFSKLISMLVSFKVWIMFFSLYIPLSLLKNQLISADNYTTIIIVVVPAIVGFREFSKAKTNQQPGLISKVRKMFNI